MKHLIQIIFSEEISRWRTYNKAAKLSSVYLVVSLLALILCAMTGYTLLIFIAIVNMAVATNIASINIPNFYDK